MSKSIKIVVYSHKSYEFPNSNLYFPLLWYRTNDFRYKLDNEGINISDKNETYCELTGLYWEINNLDEDYLGLCHYRRYFRGSFKYHYKNKLYKILSEKDLDNLLRDYDVVLPKKHFYIFQTTEKHYLANHHREGLELVKEAIANKCADYKESLNKILSKRSGHRCNMMIMKKEYLKEYSSWLFNILEYVEERLNISTWSTSEKRVFGYLGERLLDVWLDKNNIKYKELKIVNIEGNNSFHRFLKYFKHLFVNEKY